jgi:hypothetical protein
MVGSPGFNLEFTVFAASWEVNIVLSLAAALAYHAFSLFLRTLSFLRRFFSPTTMTRNKATEDKLSALAKENTYQRVYAAIKAVFENRIKMWVRSR